MSSGLPSGRRTPHDYEVIVVRIDQAGVSPWGSIVPDREEYPRSSTWGKLSWSVAKREQTLARAEMVLANLELPRGTARGMAGAFQFVKAKGHS